jgi:hypothetical protein
MLHEGQIVCILPGDSLLIDGGRCGIRFMRAYGGVSACLCLVLFQTRVHTHVHWPAGTCTSADSIYLGGASMGT